MTVTPRPTDTSQFNPPPGWPPTPAGWTPPPGWSKPAEWPDPPADWQMWTLAPAGESMQALPVTPAASNGPARVGAPAAPKGPQWYSRRWVQFSGVAVVAVLFGAIIGGAGASAANDRAYDAEQAASKAKADAATARADATKAQADAAAAPAKAQADLKARVDAVAARETTVGKREKAVGIAEAAAKANTFPGDGTFLVGTDIQPGTYRAAAMTGCYWARLKTLDTSDIIDNNNADGPVVIQVLRTDKAVQVAGCAEFHKVG